MKPISTQDLCKQIVALRLLAPETLAEALAELEKPEPLELLGHLERRQLLTSFQTKKLARGETSGYYVGRFQILYRNASGTFARVFRAVDPANGEMLAVKLLRDRHALNPETVKQFHREAQLHFLLRHPHIVRVIEVGIDQESKKPFIAMEFVEGGNLREILKSRGSFAPAETVRLGRDMVDALQYALSKRLTHRDLKPTNVLISTDGQVKLVDFGLAGVVEQQQDAQVYISEQRTVDYAGLEKATGAPKGDPRSDVFFLGAIFYLMLTGRPALAETRDRNARMLRTRFDQVPRLEGDPTVPPELARIVDRMLAFRPEARYQDYVALLRDLDAFRLGEGTAPPTNGNSKAEGPRVIVVHKNHRVQDILRDALTTAGYQVVLTADIRRAMSLMEIKAANCLIIDLDTTDREGVDAYARFMQRTAGDCAAIFFANGAQASWTDGLVDLPVTTLEKPLKLGPVYRALKRFVPKPKRLDASATTNGESTSATESRAT